MENRDEMICPCFDLTRGDIIDAIKEGANTLEKLQETLGAGTMCGVCIEDIEEILDEENNK